jgi:tetratricopeptide (TPR) repeat protein
MIEILALMLLTSQIGAIATRKGRSAGGYKALTVALWVGCEFLGIVLARRPGVEWYFVYIFGLLGAALGAVIAYLIAQAASPRATAAAGHPGAATTAEQRAPVPRTSTMNTTRKPLTLAVLLAVLALYGFIVGAALKDSYWIAVPILVLGIAMSAPLILRGDGWSVAFKRRPPNGAAAPIEGSAPEEAVTQQQRRHGAAVTVPTSTGATADTKGKAREYFERGSECAQKQDWPGAIDAFKKAEEIDPRHAQTQMGLCMSYGGAMDFEAARRHFEALKKLDADLANKLANTPSGMLILRTGIVVRS